MKMLLQKLKMPANCDKLSLGLPVENADEIAKSTTRIHDLGFHIDCSKKTILRLCLEFFY